MDGVKLIFRRGEKIEEINTIDVSRCVKLTELDKKDIGKQITVIKLTKEQGDNILEAIKRGDGILLQAPKEGSR